MAQTRYDWKNITILLMVITDQKDSLNDSSQYFCFIPFMCTEAAEKLYKS